MFKKLFLTTAIFIVLFAVTSSSALAADYAAEYWDTLDVTSPPIPSRDADLTNTTSTIDFNWGNGSPIGAGNGFIARWTKTETLSAGEYYFETRSDDGSRVYIDDVLVVNAWVDQGVTTTSNTVTLTAGSHDFRIEYYENAGGAEMHFSYYRTDPTVSTLSPADGATGVSTTINLLITFDEAVDVEAGADNDITIYKTTGDVLVETIDAGDAKITGTGTTTITINPTATLDESTEYYVKIGADTFDDSLGNGYAGISDTTSWSFTVGDFTNPTVSTLSPADGVTGVSTTANLVLTFAEAVDAEAGADNDIAIYKTTGDVLIETIDAGDAKVTGTGTTIITINPAAILLESTDYYLKVGVDAFDDISSNSYAGISDKTTWNFTVGDFSSPGFSSLSATGTDTGATVTWSTDEISSSQVEYGLTTAYGKSTSEADISPRVTDHSVALSSLQSCRRYYYRVKSSDGSSNQSISSRSSFVTTGCSVTSITTGAESSITTASGGNFQLENNSSFAKITVPIGFSTQNAVFQINRLAVAGMPGAPSGTVLIDENIFDLSAVDALDANLTSFSKNINFTVNYGSGTENSFDEGSLDIYRYNTSTGGWDDKNCTLDTSANTLSCSLSTFSIYAVFGKEITVDTSTSDNVFCSSLAPGSSPDLFQIDTTSTTATLYFTPVLGTSDYYLSFSENENAEEHGALLNLSSLGVQSYTVNLLAPNTKYNFKVRGQNGCMPGIWSNIKSVSTYGYQNLYDVTFVPIETVVQEDVVEESTEEIVEKTTQIKEDDMVVEFVLKEKEEIEVQQIKKDSVVKVFGKKFVSLINDMSGKVKGAYTQAKETADVTNRVKSFKQSISNNLVAMGVQVKGVSETIGYKIIDFGYTFIDEPTQIYEVRVITLSPTETRVTWKTNHPANGKINYGLDTTYSEDIQSDELVTEHEFTLENLYPNTDYHFEVMSHAKNYVYDANRQFKTPLE